MKMALSGTVLTECLVYLDDMLVLLLNWPLKVLDRLDQAGLKLKAKKSKLLQMEILFLGNVVSAEGNVPDPGKCQQVGEGPIPTDLYEVKLFGGLCWFYLRHFHGFQSRWHHCTN